MRQVIPGQENTVGYDVVSKALAEPITTGTVTAYLLCLEGDEAGQYWNAATEAFQEAKASAGAMTFAGGACWRVAVAAGAWLPGSTYALYAEESGGLNLVYSDTIVTWSAPTTGVGGSGWTYTVTDSVTGLPISECEVWAATDSAGSNVVAAGYTDESGEVTFYLSAGTYYIFRRKSSYVFDNPDPEVVA